MINLHGVALSKLQSSSSEAFLVREGDSVNVFGQNHPFLRGVLPTFKRRQGSKVRIKHDLVLISRNPSSPKLGADRKRKVSRPVVCGGLGETLWAGEGGVGKSPTRCVNCGMAAAAWNALVMAAWRADVLVSATPHPPLPAALHPTLSPPHVLCPHMLPLRVPPRITPPMSSPRCVTRYM